MHRLKARFRKEHCKRSHGLETYHTQQVLVTFPVGCHQHQEALYSFWTWFVPIGKTVADSHWNPFVSRCSAFSTRPSTNPSRSPWARRPPSSSTLVFASLSQGAVSSLQQSRCQCHSGHGSSGRSCAFFCRSSTPSSFWFLRRGMRASSRDCFRRRGLFGLHAHQQCNYRWNNLRIRLNNYPLPGRIQAMMQSSSGQRGRIPHAPCSESRKSKQRNRWMTSTLRNP